jgi:acyl-CoA synthetase (NDP forming)
VETIRGKDWGAEAAEKVAALLAPRNVVIVGASDKSHSWSRAAWRNLRKYNFPGNVFPLNPARESIWGEACYPNFAALPESPDHVIVVVPAPYVAGVLDDAARHGARSATIFSAGFEEAEGEKAANLARELRGTIVRTGLAVSGPNCLGNIAAPSRLMTMTDARTHDLRPGPVAIISQSGGVGTAIKRTLNDRGLTAGYLLTIGNQTGLTAADYIQFLARQPEIKVIACYLEAIMGPERFLEACSFARSAGKFVVVAKLGGSNEGRAAALAHTGSLAGSFEAFDAVAPRSGAVRVKTLDDLIEFTEFVLHAPLPAGSGLGALTFSGGLRGLLLDAAAANGLSFPPLAHETKARLAEILGVGTIIGNPLDAGFAALSSQEKYIQAINIMLDDPSIDVLLLQEEILREAGNPKEMNLRKIDDLSASGSFRKPIAYCSMISYHFNEFSRGLRRELAHTPFLQEPDKTMRALSNVFDYVQGSKDAAAFEKADFPAAAGKVGQGFSTQHGTLSETDSKAILSAYGIPILREVVAKSAEEACRAAEAVGYPVVLKIVSADIAHKSDIGGVKLNLCNESSVRTAFSEILSNAKTNSPYAKVDGVLVAPFVQGGLELALGVVRDPDVGCVLMVGAGGVLMEVIKDAAFSSPLLTATNANELLERTKVGQLLNGYRGGRILDRRSVIDAILSLASFTRDNHDRIEAVDINPYVVLEEGRGGMALDALVVLSSMEQKR